VYTVQPLDVPPRIAPLKLGELVVGGAGKKTKPQLPKVRFCTVTGPATATEACAALKRWPPPSMVRSTENGTPTPTVSVAGENPMTAVCVGAAKAGCLPWTPGAGAAVVLAAN